MISFDNAKVYSAPFDYAVIDNFLPVSIAKALSCEFPDYDHPMWFSYDNAIENKKTCNHWDRFPKYTYQFFMDVLSAPVITAIEKMLAVDNLVGDAGLHGGGWHIHRRGGKLNIHKDYSLHPKTGMERKVNLIVYLTEDWEDQWGGALELWTHNSEQGCPEILHSTIPCKFNRAVLFNTSQNSWHGLPSPLKCPAGVFRKSLAVYYTAPASINASKRNRAKFAPTMEQANDEQVLSLIRFRQNLHLS